MTDETIFVKKFPRFEDTYCLGIDEKARSLNFEDFSRSNNDSERGIQSVQDHDPEWVMPVQDAVTPCKGENTFNILTYLKQKKLSYFFLLRL